MRQIVLALCRVAVAITATSAVIAAPLRLNVGNSYLAEQSVFDGLIDKAKSTMLGDPAQARLLGAAAHREALLWPTGSRRDVALATAYLIEGEGAYRVNDIAAARPSTDRALALAERVATGSRLHADILVLRARLYRQAGQPQSALANLQNAYNMYTRWRDQRGQAKALQGIGSIYQDAQDYERALRYFQDAQQVYPNTSVFAVTANNNIANALYYLGRLRASHAAYATSLRLARGMNSPLLVTQILVNSADNAIERRDYAQADAALSEGLRLTARTAAASWRPMVLGTRAKLFLALGKLSAAQRDLGAAFSDNQERNDQLFGPVHLTAYRVYKAAGDASEALVHLEAYRRADEESRALAASTNAALMTARFDFANQNARIAALKADRLSRDVTLTRLRARQTIIAFSAVVVLLLTALLFLFVYLRSVRRSGAAIVAANARLAGTNAELEEALTAKSQFLATTSHEIRTPLNGILGMTQVILADVQVDGTVRDRVALVDSAGRAMRTLVDDILDFAKMDSGNVRIDTAAIDLTAFLPDVVALWRVPAQAKGIALRLTMTGIEAPLVTDGARVRQVLFNLLSNAVKFTAAGEVAVSARAAGVPPMVEVSVSDSGIGIPPAAFETIFEPFRQLDTSTTRQFGGTGLGLAISRTLARALGGDLTVSSTPAGSTFTLRLPYAPARAPVVPVVCAPSALLIASDNPIRRSFLRTALEAEFGHAEVCAVAEVAGAAARGKAARVVVDVADDQPPSSVTDLVRRLAAARTRAVVLLPPGQTIAAAGTVQVVAKPLQVGALTALLRTSDDHDAQPTIVAPVALSAGVP